MEKDYHFELTKVLSLPPRSIEDIFSRPHIHKRRRHHLLFPFIDSRYSSNHFHNSYDPQTKYYEINKYIIPEQSTLSFIIPLLKKRAVSKMS